VLDRLGYELVELERAGHRARPILRLRIDRSDAATGESVTVDECARVSREVEAALDAREDLLVGYILEVSSPGVERPLRKRRDFERSVGKNLALRGFEPLVAGAKRIAGVLLAVEGESGSETLRVKLADGSEATIPLSAVAKANLVFDWSGFDFGKSREEM
jgi:ribosome maturation factor RimP